MLPRTIIGLEIKTDIWDKNSGYNAGNTSEKTIQPFFDKLSCPLLAYVQYDDAESALLTLVRK